MNRHPFFTLLILALIGFAAAPATSLAADNAKASFHFGKTHFDITDTLAYESEGTDPRKPVTVIVMADFKIDRQDLLDAIDTPNALLGQVSKNQRGNFVLVALTAPDRCTVSAFLGETQQQLGLGSEFTSTVKSSSPSRLEGVCFTEKPGKMFDDSYDFRLPYAVPLTTIPKPAHLPSNGGDPGQALVALVKAIQANDWKVARLHLRDEEIARNPKPAELKDFFDGLALNYPKSTTATGGLVKGDRAQVGMKGTDRDGKKLEGYFTMKKVAGNWRVVEQYLHYAY
jgi:hypothetical protein